jgi:hypothetical protein
MKDNQDTPLPDCTHDDAMGVPQIERLGGGAYRCRICRELQVIE